MLRTILLAVLWLGACGFVEAQNFRNLTFAEYCEDTNTGLCHWDQSWASAGVVITPFEESLQLDNPTSSAVSFVEQTLTRTPTGELEILQVQARIRSENLRDKGAGLTIGVFDTNDQQLYHASMGYGNTAWVTGTNGWQTYKIQAVLPPTTGKITIGAIVYGQGKAWFDDFQVERISLIDRRISSFAREYINAALDTIARYALHKDSVDLAQVRADALRIAGSAQQASDCYLAVNYALKSLQDHHSFLLSAEAYQDWNSDHPEVKSPFIYPTHRIEQGYGYISVPGFHSGSDTAIHAFVDSLQRVLQQMEQQEVKGWIIDLRTNDGGNMAPMVAGLGPLFDPGKLGELIDVNGHANAWYYRDGTYSWDDDPEDLVVVTYPVKLKKRLPIAVLYGQRTGSSGEATLLSFQGNSFSRSFGRPSWGLTTGNGEFALPDGARIFLASTVMADRNGVKYFGPVTPDVIVSSSANAEVTDPDMEAAVIWLNDMNQILSHTAAFSQAYMNGDYDSMAAAYTEDGKIMPNGSPIIEGRAAIRQRWVLPKGTKILRHQVTPTEINILGDYAYDFGYYAGKTQRANGSIAEWKGKYVIVWRKEQKRWKMYLDIWNQVN